MPCFLELGELLGHQSVRQVNLVGEIITNSSVCVSTYLHSQVVTDLHAVADDAARLGATIEGVR